MDSEVICRLTQDEKMTAYGIKKGDPAWQSKSACVALLMKLYQNLTEKTNG